MREVGEHQQRMKDALLEIIKEIDEGRVDGIYLVTTDHEGCPTPTYIGSYLDLPVAVCTLQAHYTAWLMDPNG